MIETARSAANATPGGTSSGRSPGGFVVEEGGRDVWVVIEQGPPWLVQFLYQPPTWFIFAVAGVCCLLAAGALWKVKERGIDAETLEAIGFNLAVITGVGLSVVALRSWASLPYLLDAGLGLIVGMGTALLIRRWLIRPLLRERYNEL